MKKSTKPTLESVNKERYFKVLAPDNKHYGMIYKPNAWNEDVLPYYPIGSCNKGGLYFAPLENIFKFLHYGDGIVEVLDYKDDEGKRTFYEESFKVKAHKIKIGKKRKITPKLLNELLELGADPTLIIEPAGYCIRNSKRSSEAFTLDIFKAIFNSKIITEEYIIHGWFKNAFVEYNHPIMKFMLNKELDIHFEDDLMTYKALSYNDLKSLKFFLKYGGNITKALNTHATSMIGFPASVFDIVKFIHSSSMKDTIREIILEHYTKEDGSKYTKDEIETIYNNGEF